MSSSKSPTSKRLRNAQERAYYETLERNGEFDLNDSELWWRDRCQVFLDHGYHLRSRLHPGWIPSWKDTDLNPAYCEDSIWNSSPIICDAVRISDNATVIIKKMRKRQNEGRFSLYFSAPERASATENHCVPAYDCFQDEVDKEVEFLVMPVLRPFDDPPFEAVGEVLDFIQQTLEGLAYMHKEGVVHLDCSTGNIMMEASSLFPEGFHPTYWSLNRQGTKDAKRRRRTGSNPVKYYFIDFGIATVMTEGDKTRTFGNDGQDQEVPELKSKVPYLAAPVDIFILGNVYRKHFLKINGNLEFLRPLIDSMTQVNPDDRPTAADALAHFKGLPLPRWGALLRWRLRHREETSTERIFGDATALFREGAFLTRSVITAPVRMGQRLAHRASASTS